MIRYWERWCEDNLFGTKDILIKGKKNLVTGEAPRPRTITVRTPLVPDTYQLPRGFSTELYHAGCAVAPQLAANIIAMVSQGMMSNVNKRVPFGHNGTARRVWQAILGNEMSRPCFRQNEISLPNNSMEFKLSDSGYTVTFPLWSKAAGRKHSRHTCRLESKHLTKGYKSVLLKIAAGEWKLCDSALHWHEPKSRGKKGHWAIHLCYQRPQEKLTNLDPKQVAVLSLMGKDAEKPFEISTPGVFKPWKLGDVKVYLNELSRLETRRLEMRHRHRDKSSGRRGHGRKRVEGAIRPVTRKIKNLMGRFQWRMVSEIVRFCAQYGCGVVEFSEPSMGKRANCWFSVGGRQWDWTGFLSRLKHKLWLNGIEIRESQGGEQNPGDRSQDGSPDGSHGSVNGAVEVGANGAAKRGGSRGKGRKSVSGNGVGGRGRE